MKRLLLLLFVAVAIVAPCLFADDFVDDIYYSPEQSIRYSNPNQPIYDKGVREFIFLDDTTKQHPDTVRMIIRNK